MTVSELEGEVLLRSTRVGSYFKSKGRTLVHLMYLSAKNGVNVRIGILVVVLFGKSS